MTHDQTRRGKNSPFGFGKCFVVIVSCNLAYLNFSFRCITLLFLVWDKQPPPPPPFPNYNKEIWAWNCTKTLYPSRNLLSPFLNEKFNI